MLISFIEYFNKVLFSFLYAGNAVRNTFVTSNWKSWETYFQNKNYMSLKWYTITDQISSENALNRTELQKLL